MDSVHTMLELSYVSTNIRFRPMLAISYVNTWTDFTLSYISQMCAQYQSSHFARLLRCEHMARFHTMLHLSYEHNNRVHTMIIQSDVFTRTEFTLC